MGLKSGDGSKRKDDKSVSIRLERRPAVAGSRSGAHALKGRQIMQDHPLAVWRNTEESGRKREGQEDRPSYCGSGPRSVVDMQVWHAVAI